MKKVFYFLTVASLIVLSVFIFFVIKAQELTLFSDFVIIMIFDFALLMASGALNFYLYKDNKFLFWYAILIISLLLMFNYASDTEFQSDLHFYYYLSLGAMIVILVSLIGNVIKVEKGEEVGFGIQLRLKKGNRFLFLLFAWVITFFVMGVLVTASGHTFVGYPKFAVGSISGSLVSSFGVADWENVVLLIFPFALTFGLVYHFTKNKYLAIGLGILVAVIAFTTYHTIIYKTNIGALLGVVIWALIAIAIYAIFGLFDMGLLGLVILSAMHIGNNFWGNLFDKSVWAFQAYSSNVNLAGFDMAFLEILIACITIYMLYNIYSRKDGLITCSKSVQ